MKKELLLSISLMSFTGCAYNSSTNNGVVGVDRKQFMSLSASEMQKGASQAYSAIITKAKKENKLNNSFVSDTL